MVEIHSSNSQDFCLIPPSGKHGPRRLKQTTEQRFWSYVVCVDSPQDTCWHWLGAQRRRGYGAFMLSESGHKRMVVAHRYAYELCRGPIPIGLVLDHLCRNTRCVNPSHLEIVSHATNILRGKGISACNARKTQCIHGHEFDDKNTLVINRNGRKIRHCRACIAILHPRKIANEREKRRQQRESKQEFFS